MMALKILLTLLSASTTIAFLFLKNQQSVISIAVALIFCFFSSAIHLSAHEVGHFIGGAMSGYRLLQLQLGPFNFVINQNNKIEFSWKKSISSQCVMIPKQLYPVRFIAYNIGGILANILVVILSFLLLLSDSFWISLLFLQLLCVGLRKIIINSIPHKTDSIPNDGYTIKLLSKNDTVKKDYVIYLRLYEEIFLGKDFSLQNYTYEREISENHDEMMYYNEIQNILRKVYNSSPCEKS